MSAPDAPRDAALEALERRLGHSFTDPALLARALVHASSQQDRIESNERLEFLGDRVLGLSVAGLLYRRFPDEQEGELGYRFTALVRRETLTDVAEKLGLGDLLILASGTGGGAVPGNPAILADACEAVIGAIYLDGGFAAADAFVRRHWEALLENHKAPPKDAKTRLQEWSQGRGLPLPRYEVVGRRGPDHQPTFTVRVTVEGRAPAEAEGPSKQAAEQAAAADLLARCEEEG